MPRGIRRGTVRFNGPRWDAKKMYSARKQFANEDNRRKAHNASELGTAAC